MKYVPAETIEQAQEWWRAGIVVYKGWEGAGVDDDPSHYFVILEA